MKEKLKNLKNKIKDCFEDLLDDLKILQNDHPFFFGHLLYCFCFYWWVIFTLIKIIVKGKKGENNVEE